MCVQILAVKKIGNKRQPSLVCVLPVVSNIGKTQQALVCCTTSVHGSDQQLLQASGEEDHSKMQTLSGRCMCVHAAEDFTIQLFCQVSVQLH